MRELRFDGLSPDGSQLVLAGKDGQKYSVTIDERLEAAVRRDRARIGQVEIEQAGVLRPREIQARIRSGATAEDVAAASGLPLEHVRRFEGPVLTERAWVAQQAQATEIRRPGGDVELGALVSERLADEGVEPGEISWDAWRRDDGLWVVIATFPMGPNTHVATWTYDSGARTMTVADDNAAALSAIGTDTPLHLVAARPSLAAVSLVPEPGGAAPEPPRLARLRTVGPADEAAGSQADGAAEDQAGDLLAGDEDVSGADNEAQPNGRVPDLDAEPAEGDGPSAAESVPGGADEDSADAAAPDEAAADGEPALEDSPEDHAADAAPPGRGAAEEQAVEAPPARPSKPGRPAVPSFDDILFGPGPSRP